MMHHHSRLWMRSIIQNGLMSQKGVGGGGGYRRRLPIGCPFLLDGSSRCWWSSSSSSSSSLGGGGGGGGGIKLKSSRGFPRIPLLFLSPTCDGRILPVFNPSDRCFYDIPIPKQIQGPGNAVRGSGHGWLVMGKSSDELDDDGIMPARTILSLYNPITRAHIPLPSLPQNVVFGDFKVWCNPSKASPGQPLLSFIYGAFLNPCTNLIIHEQGGGDVEWSIEIVSTHGITSTVYHEAEAALYVLYRDGRLSVLDLPSSTLRPLLIDTPSPEMDSSRWKSQNLVVGAAGDVLRVVGEWPDFQQQQVKAVKDWSCLIKYHAFKLDRKCLKWVRTESIGNHTLFMYHNYEELVSVACDHPAAAAGNITDVRPNQIYIFKQHRAYHLQANYRDTNVMIEVSGDVKVRDLIPAAADVDFIDKRGQHPLFEISKILRAPPLFLDRYMQFAAWMIPSLS